MPNNTCTNNFTQGSRCRPNYNNEKQNFNQFGLTNSAFAQFSLTNRQPSEQQDPFFGTHNKYPESKQNYNPKQKDSSNKFDILYKQGSQEIQPTNKSSYSKPGNHEFLPPTKSSNSSESNTVNPDTRNFTDRISNYSDNSESFQNNGSSNGRQEQMASFCF